MLSADTPNGAVPLALDGQYLFTGDGTNEVQVFAISREIGQRAKPPKAGRGSITGLVSNRPRLQLKLTAGHPAPLIASLTITLPSGLRFSHDQKRLRAGIGIAGVRDLKSVLRGGKLELSWTEGANPVLLTVHAPALIESDRLLHDARRLARGRNRSPRLQVTVRVGDFAADSWRLVVPTHNAAPSKGSSDSVSVRIYNPSSHDVRVMQPDTDKSFICSAERLCWVEIPEYAVVTLSGPGVRVRISFSPRTMCA